MRRAFEAGCEEEESSEPLTQEPPVEEGSVRQGGEVRRDHRQPVVDRAMEPSIILGHELGPRMRCGDSKCCGSCDRALAKSWGKEEAIPANQPLAGTRVWRHAPLLGVLATVIPRSSVVVYFFLFDCCIEFTAAGFC